MPVPELPEVESARAAIEKAGLGRKIIDVDDTDIWECRPHRPGEIRAALLGRVLIAACRRGKSMWCQTSGIGRASTPGPLLGIHLGMSGRVLISGPDGRSAEGVTGWATATAKTPRWPSANPSGIALP
jgi:formamidopyrimidine-DNA glycosylase